jgi:type VI secretion system secreted protein VgrG
VDTAVPTAVNTAVPTAVDTAVPTAVDTAVPTAVDTAVPTAVNTAVPTAVNTAIPTAVDTAVPTAVDTAVPTAVDTAIPTAVPTAIPTAISTLVSQVDIGTSGTYGVLSSTLTCNGASSSITGDAGYTSLSGSHTVSGTNYVPAPAQAGQDQAAALALMNGQACSYTFPIGAIDLESDTTHGTTGVYTPGVYCITGAMSIGGGGTITLNGKGIYIFRSTGALTTTDNSQVVLTGGADDCDVFWTPGAATTLGANTTFIGTVIDDAGITAGTTTSWTGRALAFGGVVTLDTDTIAVPACGSVNTATFTPTATETVTPTCTETPADTDTQTPTYTPTAVNTSTQTATITATTTPTSTPIPLPPDKTIFPNPVNPYTQNLNLVTDYTVNMSEVRLEIFTSGYRKAREIVTGPVLSGKRIVVIPADKLKDLSRGTYFMKITAKDINGRSDKGYINRLVILY